MKALIVAAIIAAAPIARADEFCGPNGPSTLTGNPFAEQFCAHEHMGGARAEPVIEAQPVLPVPTESGWLLYTGVFAASFVFGGALCWRLLCGKNRRLATAQGVECGDIEDVHFTERRAITLG